MADVRKRPPSKSPPRFSARSPRQPQAAQESQQGSQEPQVPLTPQACQTPQRLQTRRTSQTSQATQTNHQAQPSRPSGPSLPALPARMPQAAQTDHPQLAPHAFMKYGPTYVHGHLPPPFFVSFQPNLPQAVPQAAVLPQTAFLSQVKPQVEPQPATRATPRAAPLLLPTWKSRDIIDRIISDKVHNNDNRPDDLLEFILSYKTDDSFRLRVIARREIFQNEIHKSGPSEKIYLETMAKNLFCLEQWIDDHGTWTVDELSFLGPGVNALEQLKLAKRVIEKVDERNPSAKLGDYRRELNKRRRNAVAGSIGAQSRARQPQNIEAEEPASGPSEQHTRNQAPQSSHARNYQKRSGDRKRRK